MAMTVDDYQVIDCDTHIIEPPDLWTARMSVARWGDQVPHVRFDDQIGEECWFSGANRLSPVAAAAAVGYDGHPPDHPKTLADAMPDTWQMPGRLARMDANGIRAQVLYPNVAGFGIGRFSEIADHELALACVQTYNDFLADWSNEAPGRMVPQMALPFWNLDASLVEMRRAHELGHKGIVMSSQPHTWGQPWLGDTYWDTLYAQAQEMGLPVNFHIGGGPLDFRPFRGLGKHANFARVSTQLFVGNAQSIVDVIVSGICHRFPRLNFVSVESGVSWIPFVLQALDWQWMNNGVHKERPEYELLPSEYFARQIYGCFWFERGEPLRSTIEYLGADHILYETDFPHPTSMYPGPASYASEPREYIEQNLLPHFDEHVLRKILHDNAAALYHLA